MVAERDGELVGYAGVDLQIDVADVMTIGVSPAAQGAVLAASCSMMRWTSHVNAIAMQ